MKALVPAVNPWQSFWIALEQRTISGLIELGRNLGLSRRKLPPHLVTGERGELEALFFLRQQGFHVVERRWRAPGLRGDLDLIAWEGRRLCFIEVKTRTARDLTPAASAVDDAKRRMLLRMSRAYTRTLARALREDLVRRFDVVSVYMLDGGVECELLRDITVEP